MKIIEKAMAEGRHALGEYEAKILLSEFGIPVTREKTAQDRNAAAEAAREIGFPVAVKGTGPELMHKTESGAVLVNIADEQGVKQAFDTISRRLKGAFEGVLVQEMVEGGRELAAGMHREPQFGPCVMLGIGGVMTELIDDAVFRVAPFDMKEAGDMADGLRCGGILGPFRGQAAADREKLCQCLCALAHLGLENENIAEIDINPLIITPEGKLKAADALVILKETANEEKT